MRIAFNTVFHEGPGDVIEPLRQVSINGVIFGPGVRISPGVAFGGVDLTRFRSFDLDGEEENGVLVLRGFYQRVQS